MIAIILAAGQSKRMGGAQPKVLLPLLGRPMINYVLGAVRPLAPDKILLVIGNSAETLKQEVRASDIEFVLQPEPRGTADAVMVCRDYLVRPEEPVMVLCGDVPLVTTESLQRLLEVYYRERALVSLITAQFDNPTGYGRIVRNGTGDVTSIVEEQDASPEVREIREINSGIYVFQTRPLLQALATIGQNPITKEYYLTDTIQWIACQGRVVGVVTHNPEEILGVNTPKELARVEAILKKRKEAGDFS